MKRTTVVKFLEAALSKAASSYPLAIAHILAKTWPTPPDMLALVREIVNDVVETKWMCRANIALLLTALPTVYGHWPGAGTPVPQHDAPLSAIAAAWLCVGQPMLAADGFAAGFLDRLQQPVCSNRGK